MVLVSVLWANDALSSPLRLFGLPPCVDVCQHHFRPLRQEGKDRDHCVALEFGMMVTMAKAIVKDIGICNALINLS